MGTRELTGEEMRTVNELRDSLNTIILKLNSLRDAGILVEYQIGPDSSGRQVLLKLNVYVPVDLKKLGS